MKVNLSGYSGRHSGTGEYGISLYVTVPNSMEPEQIRLITEAAPSLLSALENVLSNPTDDNMFEAQLVINKAKGE